jgi:phenylalanyl-tRNA synthetase beta chain
VPRHQASLRDIALVVPDDVAHDHLVAVLGQDDTGLVRSVTLFDVYRPAQPGGGIAAGERSMALRLELLDERANLTDERIDAAVAAAVQRAQTAFAARLRG